MADQILFSTSTGVIKSIHTDSITDVPSKDVSIFTSYGITPDYLATIGMNTYFKKKNYVVEHYTELEIGRVFYGDLDSDKKVVSVSVPDQKALIYHDNQYKAYTTTWVELGAILSDEDFEDKAMADLTIVPEEAWAELDGPISISTYVTDEEVNSIEINTATSAYTIYTEFKDEMEILYYTDNEAVTNPTLEITSSYSPLDDLEGDFEIITWTNQEADAAQLECTLTAIPKPQFVKLVNPIHVSNFLESIIFKDISRSYKSAVRFLLTDESQEDWYRYEPKEKLFKKVDASTKELIAQQGMTADELTAITNDEWQYWKQPYIGIGVYLEDDKNDTVTSIIDSLSIKELLPRNTSAVSDTNFYILNTTARIDVQLVGATLKGVLSDDDRTRVQYRVFLNNEPYYPQSGEFTDLADPDLNISVTFSNDDAHMDDWNKVRIEFQDFFGKMDYWETMFVGTYNGLMFKDTEGKYYSSDVGKVLKHLDFGDVIAGQTTLEQEVVLKNQYGYDVKNVHILPSAEYMPEGLDIQISKTDAPFTEEDELVYEGVLKDGEQLSFYVRLKTELGTTPDTIGNFNIIVSADAA